MLVIGLTGGIGSGKTLVANLFADRGVTVIDTDHLSRDLTRPGQPALQAIIDKLGSSILNPDHTLNRNALRKMIFADNQLRIWLEQLLHPLIRDAMKKQVKNATSPYCIIVIPLLLENSPNPLINRILIIDTNEDEQIKRTQLRDNATPDEVKAILRTQVSRAQRLAAANDIIENNGSKNDLVAQVDHLHSFYLSLAASK